MQEKKSKRTNKERSGTTRAALIETARRLFVERGYAGTGTPELVSAAAVTRGALYHHYADKQALFRAVVEAECAAVADEVERTPLNGERPIDGLILGGVAYLSAMAKRGRTRLLLIDAPAVLGREAWHMIDARHGGRTLREGLAAAMDAGAIRRLPVDAAAEILGAAYDRAALAIGAGANAKEWCGVIEALIKGISCRPHEPPP
jgi:AcrR family transcriptional regulator